MKKKSSDIIMHEKIFLWLALATGLVLLIPLIAMQFTDDVNWTLTDFIVMGALLFGMSSLFILTARTIPRKYRILTAILFLVAFLYIWAELAVGVFTGIGS